MLLPPWITPSSEGKNNEHCCSKKRNKKQTIFYFYSLYLSFLFYFPSFSLPAASAATATIATPRRGRGGSSLLPQLLLENLAHLLVPLEVLAAEIGIAPILGEKLRPRALGPAVEERLDSSLPFFFLPVLSAAWEKSRGDVVLVVLFPFEGCVVSSFFSEEEEEEAGKSLGSGKKERNRRGTRRLVSLSHFYFFTFRTYRQRPSSRLP